MPTPFVPTDDGRWVNADFERLARNIQDYDPNLQLCWIPPENRTREDKAPYAVVDIKAQAVVLHASELDTPADILTRIYLADSKNGNVLDQIEAHNLAVANLQQQEWNDEREDMMDQAKFLIKSPLNTVRFNGKKLDHLRRPVL